MRADELESRQNRMEHGDPDVTNEQLLAIALASNNPHRAGTKAAKRWEAFRARKVEKLTRKVEVERARAEVERLKGRMRECAAKVPAELGDFGVYRTRAWRKLVEVAGKLAKQSRPKRERLELVERLMAKLGSMSEAVAARIAADGIDADLSGA